MIEISQPEQCTGCSNLRQAQETNTQTPFALGTPVIIQGFWACIYNITADPVTDEKTPPNPDSGKCQMEFI